MKLLRAGGMLPSSGTATPGTPVSPVSPLLRPSRLWGALKALPLVRRFCSPPAIEGGPSPPVPASRSAPAAAAPAAPPTPAEVMEAAEADAVTSPGDGDAAAAADQPPPAASSAPSSAQVSIGAVLRTGVVMEEGRVGDGFTTPVAGPRGASASDARGRDCRDLGFPTPARSDGYTPDSEGGGSSETTNGVGATSSETTNSVCAPVVGESGFTTPAQGGKVDGFKTPQL